MEALPQLRYLFCVAVCETAAGGFSAAGIDGAVAFLDVLDLAVLVNYERGAVGNADFLDQNAVCLGDLSIPEIAEQREGSVYFGGKFFLGGSVVRANSKNLGAQIIKFGNTSLVCQQFLRSTTGKSSREEGQNHGGFPAEIGQMDRAARGGGQREIRGHIPNFQVGVRRIHILAGQAGGHGEPEHG